MRGLLRGIPEDCLLAASTKTFFAGVTKRGSVISFSSRFYRFIILLHFRHGSLVLKSSCLFDANDATVAIDATVRLVRGYTQ